MRSPLGCGWVCSWALTIDIWDVILLQAVAWRDIVSFRILQNIQAMSKHAQQAEPQKYLTESPDAADPVAELPSLVQYTDPDDDSSESCDTLLSCCCRLYGLNSCCSLITTGTACEVKVSTGNPKNVENSHRNLISVVILYPQPILDHFVCY